MTKIVWKLSEHTQKLLKGIDREIKSIECELTNGVLLTQKDEKLVLREYFLNLGVLQGLHKVKDFINYEGDESNDEV